jgi:uncharacterized membrane protein
MADETKHLFVLSFPDRAGADAAVNELTELSRDMFLDGVKDYAIVSKDADGKLELTESKDADPGGRRGAVAGGLGGAFLALAATPIGLGAIVVGAGVGAVASALRDSGFKDSDLKEVGALMEGGRTVLLLAADTHDADRLRGVLDDIPEFKAADRRFEADVVPGSKNILRDAIAQYRAEHPATIEPTS